MVRIILRQDVEKLGDAGEVVDVKAGYARNFLLPQGLAYEATDANLRRLEEERRHVAARSTRDLERAEAVGERLAGVAVTFHVKAGEEGRLFGSVTTADIAQALAEQGHEIDRHIIQLDEPIKQLGVYKVPVRLHADVQPEISVWVVAET
ncbi:MAG: 50S ribosomal protein L9 [Gemmatimonadota bacterium]|nr:50S ribosomal protein L9 [Gemmatimonadota bacterium]